MINEITIIVTRIIPLRSTETNGIITRTTKRKENGRKRLL